MQWDAAYEIVHRFSVSTPIGPVVLCKVTISGNALIAGPSIISDMESIIEYINSMKVSKIMIDGAFSRHGFARISQATIAVIGANYNSDMNVVVENAKSIVEKFSLEKPDFDFKNLENAKNICKIYSDNNIYEYDIDSILGTTAKIFLDQQEKCRFLYLPKSLPNELVDFLVNHREIIPPDIIVKSPMNIQLTDLNMKRVWKLINHIYTLHPMNLVAVCYNPYSPKGYEFDHKEFKNLLENKLKRKVYNVKEVAHE
ncbi:MAG: hypothetical protein JXL85_02150 [Bacilli bacterium]|nr:hypothetical protein [Bacilli bacterium]